MQPTLQQWLSRQPSGPKPKKRLPRVSKRRKIINPAYVLAKQAHLRDNPKCQVGPIIRAAGFKVRCKIRATHVHHIRGRVGKYLCDRTYFLSSCNGECHPLWVHQLHPKEARALGLLE